MTSSSPKKTGARPSIEQKLAAQLESDLLVLHGPLMGGSALYFALGYRSAIAFRTALSRNQVSVKVFCIEFRRGKYALTKDVAAWLAKQAGSEPQSHSIN